MSTVPDKKGEKPTEDKKEEKNEETPQDKKIDDTSIEKKEGEKKEGEEGEKKEGEEGEKKESEEEENKEGEDKLEKKTFNNKSLEKTTKTVNKVNFSRSRELADKYADQLIDSAERYGKGITLDKIKEKLGKDLFRNLKQTSLKYFFEFVSNTLTPV
jgi:hypothetical protein